MNKSCFSYPVSLENVKILDSFWNEKIDLIENKAIPYQFDALCNKIEGAPKSNCIRNFLLAHECIEKRKQGIKTETYPTDKWEYTDGNSADDSFKGWVFQDTDLYKWIEAASYCYIRSKSEKIKAQLDYAVGLIEGARAENGYIDTLYIINNPNNIFENLKDFHELYCFGHLAQAAVAHFRATGEKNLLSCALGFADFIYKYFIEEEHGGYPGHEIAEMALVQLFELTGNEKYLECAREFINRRGTKPYFFDEERDIKSNSLNYFYNQAHLPVREQKEAVGHAVRGVYLYSAMADLSRLDCDETLFEASKSIFNNIRNKKMYITGGIGSTADGEAFSYNYDLPNDSAYAESCASIGLAYFARRMMCTEPDSVYADVIERTLYNGILSGISRDGEHYFYTNPLEVNPKACEKDSRLFHIKSRRQKWFGCACCPANIARTVSSVGEYIFTQNKKYIFVNLYISSEAKCNNARIKISSEFPFGENVTLNISEVIAPFTLALRIPEWCNDFTFSKNNPYIKHGYAYFEISSDCEISAEFKMNIKIIRCNTAVRENTGKAAITRGPLVYCLEECRNFSSLHLARLCKNPKFKLDNRSITANGLKEKETSSNELYYEATAPLHKSVRLTFTPYYDWCNSDEGEMTVFFRY